MDECIYLVTSSIGTSSLCNHSNFWSALHRSAYMISNGLVLFAQWMVLIHFRTLTFWDFDLCSLPTLPEKIPLECISTLPFLINFTFPGARTMELSTKELPLFRYSTIHDSETLRYSNSKVFQSLWSFTYQISHIMLITACCWLTPLFALSFHYSWSMVKNTP